MGGHRNRCSNVLRDSVYTHTPNRYIRPPSRASLPAKMHRASIMAPFRGSLSNHDQTSSSGTVCCMSRCPPFLQRPLACSQCDSSQTWVYPSLEHWGAVAYCRRLLRGGPWLRLYGRKT
ncbi:hypothetical protein VFPBJ_09226 [Purpureocillium lilacinum]|uniref:Uncharacterized protein n=1 Tax=Purpureocillium lilacinum TaxID=33203 RepID=A0A179GCY2_PURLI|nr:hypothetical protein VFPBJ_09226 [Purpureocillium lilacinum]